MPHPLPRRINLVVSNRDIDCEDAVHIKGNINEELKAIQNARPDKNIYIIGGANLLMQTKPIIQRAFVTRIPGEYMADVSIDLPTYLDGFRLVQKYHIGSCVVEDYVSIREQHASVP